MDYRVDLPDFQGPLDLLLYLVKKNEVDILDIPIAKVATQFQEYLAVLHVADVEIAGDFLVMASTLMEIKSRMLLPQSAPTTEREEADPRRELVKQLVEYKKFKEAAARLESLSGESQQRMPRRPVGEIETPSGPPAVRAVELWDLVSAFGRLLSETQSLQPGRVIADDTPQVVYLDQVRAALVADERVRFRDLFTPPFHKVRLIGLFLAILELIRGTEAKLEQDELYGEIYLRAASPKSMTGDTENTGKASSP
jgi:segregation and condensation protein A